MRAVRRGLLPTAALALLLAGAPAAAQQATTTAEPIPDAIWQAMQGVSWHPGRGCPSRDELALLTVPFLDFEGVHRTGQMIVARRHAADLQKVFDRIFRSGAFRIERMDLVDAFGGDDGRSMAANNTSAFNCRFVGASNRLSEHAFGAAIDINPVQNPYVTSGGALPPAGAAYDEAHERTADVPGLVIDGDVVTSAFRSVGWVWGGDWKSRKDYQHFSHNGR